MTLGEHVFLYCERGTNEALLAEPVNALSNGAFLLAALAGFFVVMRQPEEDRNADQYLLPVLVLFIGLGSLAFHLYANSAAQLLDVVPIGVFMLAYLTLALNRFLGIPPATTAFLVIGFAAIASIVMQVRCGQDFIGFPPADLPGVRPCLNGSLAYLPALLALIVIGLALSERGHKAAPWLLWAAALFAVSITLRSLDLALCDKVVFQGRTIGTHATWHVLNALMLFLLIRASLEGGPAVATKPHAETPVEFLRPEEVETANEPSDPVSLRPAAEPDEAETQDEKREKKSFFPA
jgi:ceramidase